MLMYMCMYFFLALGLDLVEKLRHHPVVEISGREVDRVLCGLLTLTRQLLIKCPYLKEEMGTSQHHGLVRYILQD